MGQGGNGGVVQGDGVGDVHQARRRDDDALGVAPVDAVADAMPLETAVLAAGAAALADAAAVGENRGDAFAGDEVSYLRSDFLDDAGYLVA